MTTIEFEAEKYANVCFFKDELTSEIRKGAFKKGSELIIDELEILRTRLYNSLPSGEINCFELIKLLKNHIYELDVILKMK